jgi:nucleoside-triphosphatase THEP1
MIVILTAPIQSGKTTSLINWSAKRQDVYGMLTPIVNGKKVFMNANTKEQFPMEAVEGETKVLTVGKFIFSKSNFDKAVHIIKNAINKPGWLIIDEIGPLELNGLGFHDELKEVLANRRQNSLLVVRDKEEMVEKVKTFFGINNAIIIRIINETTEL